MIKSWGLVILSTIFLITILFFVTNYSLKSLSFKGLDGRWIGSYNNYTIILAIKKDSKCSIKLKIESLNEIEEFNGYCRIDSTKKPYSFIMSNIKELNTSLYALISLRSNNQIHMSEFSTKWRLRPVTLTDENTIIFRRNT